MSPALADGFFTTDPPGKLKGGKLFKKIYLVLFFFYYPMLLSSPYLYKYYHLASKVTTYMWSESLSVMSDPAIFWTIQFQPFGILQARIQEWVAFSFSRASSQPRDWIQVFCIAGGFFTSWATRESPRILKWVAYPFSNWSSQPRNRIRVSCIAGGFFTNWPIREAQVICNDWEI